MSECKYGDPFCPCPDGDACHYEWDYERKTPPIPHPKHRRRRPKGECSYCDQFGDDPMMPRHTPSDRCESGKHPHCTCDTCF
jgi:hypothetical protein